MRIQDWMTKEVVSVTEDISMMKASRLMKEHAVHRLPVIDESMQVIGIISDRDIKEASPSKATTLDMHELYYLLSEIRVKDIMTRNPVCMLGDDSVEQAALIMLNRHIGGIPITDEDGKLIGIITDSDIFKLLISITGAAGGGIQLTFDLPSKPGSLRAVLDALREYESRVISVLTSQKDDGRRVYIRVANMGAEREEGLVEAMRARFNLVYWHPRFKEQADG